MFQHTAARRRLIQSNQQFFFIGCFNTQPPEGGWAENEKRKQELAVSTHSRPKAAAGFDIPYIVNRFVSTHSRPKAAEM